MFLVQYVIYKPILACSAVMCGGVFQIALYSMFFQQLMHFLLPLTVSLAWSCSLPTPFFTHVFTIMHMSQSIVFVYITDDSMLP